MTKSGMFKKVGFIRATVVDTDEVVYLSKKMVKQAFRGWRCVYGSIKAEESSEV